MEIYGNEVSRKLFQPARIKNSPVGFFKLILSCEIVYSISIIVACVWLLCNKAH